MPDQLSIYNGALRSVGERKLASLSENVEARRLLDDVWGDEWLDTVLLSGQWDFAARIIRLEHNESITSQFGYQYTFDIPSDHVRTKGLAEDEYFSGPMLNYKHAGGFWLTDLTPIYVTYVSSDALFGADMSLWPANFYKYVQAWFGEQILPNLTQSDTNEERHAKKLKLLLRKARNTDAMEAPAKFPPMSSWARSRFRRQGGDRGTRQRLIG